MNKFRSATISPLIDRVHHADFDRVRVEVAVLRLDKLGGDAPGNKSFKLKHNIAAAQADGYRRVLSFGGPWSNHLHALSALAPKNGLESIAVVRGHRPAKLSDTLQDCEGNGMRLHFVSREQYRRRYEDDFHCELQQVFGDCFVIPEGGANELGVSGCAEIGELIRTSGAGNWDCIAMACGTGGTLAGLANGLPASSLLGVSVLKGDLELHARITGFLDRPGQIGDIDLWHNYHFGGYAKLKRELAEFCRNFTAQSGIPVEPVYTGKCFYAVCDAIKRDCFPAGSRVLMIHTDGLQGLRGMDAAIDRLLSVHDGTSRCRR